MDFRIGSIFYLFVLSFLLCLQSRAEDTASVFFIDSSTRQFLRTPSSNDVVQPDSMLPSEVGAAVSVLLGFSPPLILSAAGSSKLNEVLKPNPFDRPRAVLILEVQGTDPKLVVNSNNAMFSSASERKVSFGLEKAADIQLPDENKVSVLSLDEPLADYTDKETGEFASWMDGSYIANSVEPLNGDLTIPLADGANVNLHMSKKADRDFIVSLLSLIRNFRRAVELHEDLAQSTQSPAELITGCFDGFKALSEQYGSDGVSKHGVDLLVATLSKIFDSFQEAYKEACKKNTLDASLHTVKQDEKEHLDFPIAELSENSRSLSQESEGCKNALEISLREVNESEKEHPDLSITPFSEISRPSIRLPFSFSGKLPLSSLLSVGSSAQFCPSQKPRTKYSLSSRLKFETHLQMIPEDETPEALNGTSDVKSTSPNSKRVSPPKQQFGSTAQRMGRKLILRSIPPFPSLSSTGEQ